jgi:NAD(P) transhydrogenase subunit beta
MMIDPEAADQLFPDTDVVVVVGACDVVNPAAMDMPDTPISAWALSPAIRYTGPRRSD